MRNVQVDAATKYFSSAVNNCSGEPTRTCLNTATETYRNLLYFDSAKVADIILLAIGPVIAGWTLVYLTVKIVRWVKAGF
jgi:hypothetical protein